MNESDVYSRAGQHPVVKILRKTGTKSSRLASQLSRVGRSLKYDEKGLSVENFEKHSSVMIMMMMIIKG